MAASEIDAVLIHAVYLLNCASEDPEIRAKSVASLTHSLRIGEQIGACAVVLHPGSAKTGDVASAIGRAPVGLGNLAWALDLALADTREVAIAGDAGAEDTRTMVRAVLDRWNPWRVLAWGEADGVPLLDGRPAVGGHATAYVCRGFVCDAPTSAVAELQTALEVRPPS